MRSHHNQVAIHFLCRLNDPVGNEASPEHGLDAVLEIWTFDARCALFEGLFEDSRVDFIRWRPVREDVEALNMKDDEPGSMLASKPACYT